MDDHILLLFSILLLILILFIKHIKLQYLKIKTKTRCYNPPPSPSTSLPILGHLHLLLKQKQPLHHFFSTLSSIHGPILSLRLASLQTLIISSLSTAAQCFSSHNDIVFANRPHLFAGKHLGYNYTTIAWASYGPHWRNLRRLTTLELFSTSRLNSFSFIRKDEVLSLVKSLVKDNMKVVCLKERLFELTLNIMMRMIAGKRYFGSEEDDHVEVKDKEEGERFRDIVEETFRVSGNSNLTDFLPFLRLFGYGGMERRVMRLHEKRDAFLQELIDKHRGKRVNNKVHDGDDDDEEGERRTVLDVMLRLQVDDPEYYTDEIIKGVVVMMLTAGTDTSVVTIEWAMSMLLNHPEVLSKVKKEISTNIGEERLVTESDLVNLHFLQYVINETLRLKPAAPIIPAHESSEDCKVAGFDVPQGTMLLVNAWAIHRDPDVWVKPNEFQPERWLGKEGDERQKMLPFGIGRRSCPGEGLAMRVVGLTLASLIQCFEWHCVDDELVDLSEGPGLTMPKAHPLMALCEPRAIIHKTSFNGFIIKDC